MTIQARQRKSGTQILLLQRLLQTPGGPVRLRERRPSPLPLAATQVAHLARGLRVSSRSTLVLEHRGSIQRLPRHLVASHLVLGFQGSSHQGHQASFLLVLELRASSLGSTPLKELLDSSLEALARTQLDRFPLGRELLLGRTHTCLSLEVSQGETECTDQVAQVDSLLRLTPTLSQPFLPEASPRSRLDPGVLEVEASHQRLVRSVLVLGLWIRMVAQQLQEACW